MTAPSASSSATRVALVSDRARLLKFVPVGDPTTCWLWKGCVDKRSGYGLFRLDGRSKTAHRCAYILLVGPVPDGFHVDHLCRVRACVNPAHLEPVTPLENHRRGVHARRVDTYPCHHGGPRKSGSNCLACASERSARWRQAVKAGLVDLTYITCADCGDYQPNCARGLCRKCYTRWYRRSKRAKSLESATSGPA